MPRTYQEVKNNPYKMPHNVYMQMFYIIKDYARFRDNADSIRFDRDALETEAVIHELAQKYKHRTYSGFDPYRAFHDQGYFNLMHVRNKNNPDDLGPSNTTWKRYRYRFIYMLAKRLNKS